MNSSDALESCAVSGCSQRVIVHFWGAPLCSTDFGHAVAFTKQGLSPKEALARVERLVEWRLAPSLPARHSAIAQVMRLACESGAMVQASPVPRRRRLSDLLDEIQYAEAQLQVLQEAGKPHRTSDLQARIAAMHRRLDGLEQQARQRASRLWADGPASIKDIRTRLTELERHGPHRRRHDSQPQ